MKAMQVDALQINTTHSDQARARVCAERACEAKVLCEGEDNPETEKVKKLMEIPAQHLEFWLVQEVANCQEASAEESGC